MLVQSIDAKVSLLCTTQLRGSPLVKMQCRSEICSQSFCFPGPGRPGGLCYPQCRDTPGVRYQSTGTTHPISGIWAETRDAGRSGELEYCTVQSIPSTDYRYTDTQFDQHCGISFTVLESPDHCDANLFLSFHLCLQYRRPRPCHFL